MLHPIVKWLSFTTCIPYLLIVNWKSQNPLLYCFALHISLTLLSHIQLINMASCLPNASPFLVMLAMCLLISTSEAEKYVVGGSEKSWKFPLSKPDSLSHWANSHRFKIGDTLSNYSPYYTPFFISYTYMSHVWCLLSVGNKSMSYVVRQPNTVYNIQKQQQKMSFNNHKMHT